MSHSARRASVQEILENANAYDWSLQDNGVLRLCLSDTVWLEIWDAEYASLWASAVHTEATVIAGELANCPWRPSQRVGKPFNRQVVGGGLSSRRAEATHIVRLTAMREKTVCEAGRYRQRAHEIHETRAIRGTVTLVELRGTTDGDLAHVFWPVGEECVTSESRPATDAEVAAITSYALERWFVPSPADADERLPKLKPRSRAIARTVPATSAPCTCPAPEDTATTDPRVDVLAAGLLEIEAGGPGGLVTWGATGMRDRARAALVEAGLLPPGARRRAAAETEYGLSSALGW